MTPAPKLTANALAAIMQPMIDEFCKDVKATNQTDWILYKVVTYIDLQNADLTAARERVAVLEVLLAKAARYLDEDHDPITIETHAEMKQQIASALAGDNAKNE